MSQVATNRRRIRNMLLEPGKQYRHALTYFAFIAAGALVLQAVLVRTTQRFVLDTLIASGVDPSVLLTSMNGALREYMWRSALMFPLLALLSLFFAVRMTHRFLGPQVAIQRHIAALREGDYDAVCKLRAKDELQDVAESLNELAEALRTRHAEDDRPRAA